MRLSLLHPLDRKLLRDLWHIKGQALAIALVIAAGVGMYVMAKGMLISLQQTRDAYYERYRFAQVFAPARRAPRTLRRELLEIDGIRAARDRIRAPALIDLPNQPAPISGEILSLPQNTAPTLNDLVMRSGRRPDPARPDEVVVLESFAEAHRLQPGMTLSAIIDGHKRSLRIVGLALSPEFIYAMPPGEIVPDPGRFGVVWMSRDALAAATDLDGAFNELLVLLQRGARQTAVIAALDRTLADYGGNRAYGRERHLSDRFLDNEIQQLEVMGHLLPPIFLLVAAFLLNVVISRLIETERPQIGLLKAFGYNDARVAWHYLKFTGLICLAGIGLGWWLGYQLGAGLALLYMEYFKFPFLLFQAPPAVYAGAAGFSLVMAAAGSWQSVRTVLRLQPAIAMVPPPPPDYSGRAGLPERLGRLIDQPSRMILRHISRWPARAALTVIGIAMAMGLLIGSSFSLDAMEHMIDVSFNVIDRQDASVTFTAPRHGRALQEISRAPGVLHAEGFRAVDATLRNGHRQRREAILGVPAGATLSRVVDTRLQSVTLPDHGLVLSDKLAELLAVEAGDKIEIAIAEGRRPRLILPVTRVAKTFLGTSAYMALPALNTLMREPGQLSGAHLLIDPRQVADLHQHLKALPAVAGISLQDEAQTAFYDTLEESLGTFTFFNTLFAALIAIGVVYNSARVSLSERGRELASLRVLGLSRGEVSYILLGELALLTLLALPLGAGLGYALAAFLTHSFDTELFRIPLIVDASTYGYAALVVVIAAVASGLIVRRRIDHLDLVAVLKTRE